MGLLDRARHALNYDNDALADQRMRVGRQLCALGAGVLSPFALVHAVLGTWHLVAINAIVAATLLANALALKRGRAAVVPFWALGSLLVAGVCASTMLQGVNGLIWAYPAVFIFFFILPRRVALLLGVLMLAGATATGTLKLGVPTGSRVFVSLAFVLVMINVVLNVMADLQRALMVQATTDPLTGAYNRRHLQTHLAQLVAPVGSGKPMDALLVIDIDHFKQINDRFGHDAGDEVLRRLVAAISARKRRSDLLFRIGGEEFLLLLPRASLAAAQRVADELRLRLQEAELLPGEQITVSVGVSALEAGQSAEDWVKRADLALYEAKRAGRNRVSVAEPAAA